MAADSDSDYNVEEFIRPPVTVPLKNGEAADLLGNFKDISKDEKQYQSFPKEIFQDDYDHDKKFEIQDGPPKKEKSTELKKKIRKKVMAKIGRAKMKRLAKGGTGT